MAFRLQRHPQSPVLLPEVGSNWECNNVFNPSVIHHNGLFHMHYRAQGLDWVSRIGYAVSADGNTVAGTCQVTGGRLVASVWTPATGVVRLEDLLLSYGITVPGGWRLAVVNDVSADGKTFVVYYSPDIVAANKDYDPTFAKLPGLAMQYEIESGKMKFKYTISKVSLDPVPIAKFDFPTAGYRVMTYEENQQLKKGN